MPINDVIAQQADIEALSQEQQRQNLRTTMSAPTEYQPRSPSRTSLSPVIQLEKSDIHFWVDVATLVVLVAILMRM